MKNIIVLLLGLFFFSYLQGQPNPKAEWSNISWLAGDWIGDGFGGISYETWSEPINGIMLGTYRHVSDNKNNFFELFTIAETEDNSFVLKLRHFNPDMSAWEDKTGHLVWELKKVTDTSVTFGPCTYTKVDDDTMEISLIMKNEGKIETEVFHFKRR